MDRSAEVSVPRLMKEMSIQVTVKGRRRALLRLRIARPVFCLAAHLAGLAHAELVKE